MAAPKIKLYLLPPTYTTASDDDVKLLQGDELLPVVDKNEALESVRPMRGVRHAVKQPCYPINYNAGLQTAAFSTTGGLTYTPNAVTPSTILVGPSGQLRFRLYDGLNELPLAVYDINTDNSGLFQSVTLDHSPSGSVSGKYYLRATTPCEQWALPASSPYDGPNYIVSKIIVEPTGGPFTAPVPYRFDPRNNDHNISLAGPSGSFIQTQDPITSLKITYWWQDSVSNYFAADDAHWVHDHMRLNPDIFVGDKDYPGDQGEVNGEPYIQGTVPQFREVGTYQIDFNEGWVKFPEMIDSSQYTVRANYANLLGIRQVKHAVLFPTPGASGYKWQLPESTTAWPLGSGRPQDYPEAAGKQLVNHNDTWMPRIIWINGQQVGQPITVTPYEVLTAKLS